MFDIIWTLNIGVTQLLVFIKMGITASYRSLSADLKDAMAAHGSEHPCRSHFLGSMFALRPSLFFSKRAETVP